MTSSDDGDKGAPPSGPILGQEDRQEHEQKGQSPERRESAEVPAQATVGHDANGPAASDGEAGNQADRRKRGQHVRPLRDWGPIVAIANVILAFVGVGGLIFTGLQLGEMRQQLVQNTRQADAAEEANKIASQALSSADRAWLQVLLEAPPDLLPDQDFEATVKVQNSGKTPAQSTKFSFVLSAVPNETNNKIYTENKFYTPGVIFPNSYAGAKYTLGKEYFGTVAVENVKDGSYVLTIKGIVLYKDINNKDHKTIFCGVYNMKAKGFVPCDDGNENFAD